MYQLTCRLHFDAAHRLFGYEGPCANLHGHHYVVEVAVQGELLDELGMLIDFGELKCVIKRWLDRWWDHNTLLHPADPLEIRRVFGAGETYRMDRGNPTAENMAQEMFGAVKGMLSACVMLVKVRLYETPDCWVEYTE